MLDLVPDRMSYVMPVTGSTTSAPVLLQVSCGNCCRTCPSTHRRVPLASRQCRTTLGILTCVTSRGPDRVFALRILTRRLSHKNPSASCPTHKQYPPATA